jgi:hypothetical protein
MSTPPRPELVDNLPLSFDAEERASSASQDNPRVKTCYHSQQPGNHGPPIIEYGNAAGQGC